MASLGAVTGAATELPPLMPQQRTTVLTFVRQLERELAEAHKRNNEILIHAGNAERYLSKELAEAQDAAARWYTAATPYATPMALYEALRAQSAGPEGDGKDYKALWLELIYEVGNAYPGESRHQTAKRYIHERENQPCSGPAQASKSDATPDSQG